MYKQKIHKFIYSILQTRYSLENAVFTVLAIIITRLGIELWLGGFELHKPSFYLFEFIHTTTFFSLFFIICIFILTKISTIKKQTSITIFLFAFLMITLPPIFDKIITTMYFNDVTFMSYYLFDSISGLGKSFITFFGDQPTNGITYGTRIMTACAIIFFMFITWLKTKNIFRTLLIAFVTYFTFFVLSSFPSIIAFATLPQHFSIMGADVAALIASPSTILSNRITNPIIAINVKMSLVYIILDIIIFSFILYKSKKTLFIALAKNIRPIQTTYHIGLLVIGIVIALTFGEAILLPSFFTILAFILLCISVIFAWYSTVIFNDCIDKDIDTISNPSRPLIIGIINIHDYKKIGLIFAILSIIIMLAVSPAAAVILMIYHSLSFLYNTPPLRLKKFPIIATFIAALASFFIVVIGFVTIVPDHSFTNFPPHIAILLIVAYTISLPIKDLKDIEGDKANNIYTIPVLFGEKTGRTIIAMGIFISFMLSVFVLGTKIILIPALLAGTLSFWTLVGHKKDKFIFSPKQAIGIVFLIASIYAVILVLSFFV